jgi:anti-anti-sigma factor
MQFSSIQYADVVVAAPVGRIDHTVAAALEEALAPLLGQPAGNPGLVLDFRGVDYISSVGLRVLMIAAKRMRACDARLAVANLKPIVAEIFAISRFDTVLDVHASLEHALGALSPAALAAYASSQQTSR